MERDQSGEKLGEIAKVPDPEQLLFEGAEGRSTQPWPSGRRTNAGEDSIPRNRISF